MDVNLTISLMRGQMGAVIEKAVNVAVETVLGEMIRVVGLKFEEIKREMNTKEKENENIRRMLETSRSQMKTMRKYITVLTAKDQNRLYHGDMTQSVGVHTQRGPTSTVSMCTKASNPCIRPRLTEPAPVAGPSWVRQHMHVSKPQNIQEPMRSENHIGDIHIEEIHGSSAHKVDHSSHQLVDSQGLLSETSDPIWGQNPLTSADTEHTDMPDTGMLSTSMMTDDPSQTAVRMNFGAPSLKIKKEEPEVEIVCVKDEPSEAASSSRFEYPNHELQQQVGEPDLGVPLDLPGSFQPLQSPSTSAELTIPAFVGLDPSTSDVREMSPGSFETNPCTPVERAILELQGEMGLKISHLTALVQALLGNRCPVPLLQEEEDDEDCILPVMSMEDLDQLDLQLRDREVMQKLVNKLSTIGGHTMRKTVSRICAKVLGSSVAKKLNWCGRGDKRGLNKTHVGTLIIAAAMRNKALHAPTEAEAEKCIKDFLRWAPGRPSPNVQ